MFTTALLDGLALMEIVELTTGGLHHSNKAALEIQQDQSRSSNQVLLLTTRSCKDDRFMEAGLGLARVRLQSL